MSQRFECQINNKLKKGTPKVYLGIPGTGKTGNRLLDVKWKNGERVPVNSYKNWLVIKAPKETDIRQCSLHIGRRVDVDTKCRIKKREWRIEFPSCDDPHGETPADINITLAPDEDNELDPPPEDDSGSN